MTTPDPTVPAPVAALAQAALPGQGDVAVASIRVVAREVRPRYHLTPPSGWMNDPNGPIFVDGRLHAFYQHNPLAAHWDRIHWGHAVSDDLIHWEHWPIALTPGDEGPDSFGCWSGCTVIDDDGTPTILYTGVELRDGIRHASVCLATSEDGLRTWTKAPAPVVDGAPPGIERDLFRDPFAFRDEGGWSMLVGAGTSAGTGAILLYRSPDLRAWSLVGTFLAMEDLADPSDAGGPCWECPQLLRDGDRAALIVSVMDAAPASRPSHVVAIAGSIEGDRFVPTNVERLDSGPDFYAPASVVAPDGRDLLLGWIPEDPPHHTDPRDWAGALTLPREIVVRDDGGLRVGPARELATARGEAIAHAGITIRPDPASWLHQPVADRFELVASIAPDGATAVGLELHDGDEPDAEMLIVFRPEERRVSVKRRGTVHAGGPDERNVMVIPPDAPLTLDLTLVVDGSVMEVFVDGRVSATFRLPAVHVGRRSLVAWSHGGESRFDRLEVRPLVGA